jgi:hypothetical protein
MTTVQFKFNLGESVWVIVDNKAVNARIVIMECQVKKEIKKEIYINTGTEENWKLALVKEENCYFSKEELINNL